VKLKDLYRRRQIKSSATLPSKYSAWGTNFDVIEGPYGYVSMSPQGGFIDVVVDITSTKLMNRTIKLLQDPTYNLTSDGEYNFRLNLSSDLLALQLVGLQVSRNS
jgi:hypothetical protein